MPLARIVRSVIHPEDYIKMILVPETGGLATFSGIVRKTEDGRELKSLLYEAHESMALKKITEIIEEAIKRFGLLDAIAVHRIGEVEVGETSVFTAAASVHRKDAFRGCEFIIDRIKLDCPIWKKDIFTDGERWRSENIE
ncbi:MAG: molybdenum cofactor biosynthesis protein MoaE [Thermoplasmataceae archaeon]